MRTTISLDDDLGEAARRRARREGLSLSALVARADGDFARFPRLRWQHPLGPA